MNIDGVLTIRTIYGSNGPFNIGLLITHLGEFYVKEALLDQYDEGRYNGNFYITRIYSATFPSAGGRVTVEIRAAVKSMRLEGIDDLRPEDTETVREPDPADEQTTAKTDGSKLESHQTEVKLGESNQDADEELFGTLWPLGTQVKLDCTVNRKIFRRQTQRLNELKYTFEPQEQIWYKNAKS